MDLFREESINKVGTGINNLFYILAYGGMAIFGFFFINTFLLIIRGNLSPGALISSLIFMALTYGCYILRNNQNIEYDYTFTNGIFDIAKVINNTKRKKLLTTNIKDFEIIAPTSDQGFQRMLQHKEIKNRYNYFLNRGSRLYYGIFIHDGRKSMLVFEPSDEMLNLFKTVNPRNVKMLS